MIEALQNFAKATPFAIDSIIEAGIELQKLGICLLRYKRRQRWYNKLFNKWSKK